MNTPWCTLVLLSVLGASLASGCEEEDPTVPPEDCDERFSGQAAGRWTLRAEGTRFDCKDPDLNGDLTIEMLPFTVQGKPLASDGSEIVPESGNASDAFVERIRRARYVLALASSSRRDFEFEGAANTCEVNFAIREELKGGDVHEYEFSGFVQYSSRIYGTFAGAGPERCQSQGTFEIEVR